MEAPIYGEEYICFLSNEYIGTATFTNDPYIGDCFILWEIHKSRGIREIALLPDNWILKTEQDC